MSIASPAAVPATPSASPAVPPADPIVGPLLRLALPTVAVLVVQTFVGVAEIYFVGFLGTDALAGMTLVFPVLMLMTMMANGAIGGGVSSAVARALGAGRRHDADALVVHGLVVGAAFGLAFTALVLGAGGPLFGALGGSGAAVAAAERYAAFVFGAAALIWTVNLMAAALRGAGQVKVPALVSLGGAVIVVPLSPALIFGLGPLPRLGIAGAGIAIVIYYVLALAVLSAYLRAPRSPLRLGRARLEGRLFRDILSVGGLSAVGTVQTNLTVAVFTALVGRYGTAALAGYGLASRLDYVLIPLLFGLGTATIAMVGQSVGAGRMDRAWRIAWISAAIGTAVTEAIGLSAAAFPAHWMGLFTADGQVIAAGGQYLRIAGPFYGLVGLGMMLYFAAQGAKRVAWPVFAGTLRLVVAVAGGWAVIALGGGGITALFWVAAAASVAFGGTVALSALLLPWRRAA